MMFFTIIGVFVFLVFIFGIINQYSKEKAQHDNQISSESKSIEKMYEIIVLYNSSLKKLVERNLEYYNDYDNHLDNYHPDYEYEQWEKAKYKFKQKFTLELIILTIFVIKLNKSQNEYKSLFQKFTSSQFDSMATKFINDKCFEGQYDFADPELGRKMIMTMVNTYIVFIEKLDKMFPYKLLNDLYIDPANFNIISSYEENKDLLKEITMNYSNCYELAPSIKEVYKDIHNFTFKTE